MKFAPENGWLEDESSKLTWHSTWKWMVGIRSSPFGILPIFRCYISFREGCSFQPPPCRLDPLVLLGDPVIWGHSRGQNLGTGEDGEGNKNWGRGQDEDLNFSGWWQLNLFLCSSLFGEMIQFDEYFSDGLKPPTSFSNSWNLTKIHETMNGTESQRTTFSKLLLELLDTKVFSGSVKRGSCWRFLG